MTEIVRMTSQMAPLEMGVPLYPFSHSGVFPINKNGSSAESAGAPLPDSSSYDEHQSNGSPASVRGVVHTPPMGVPGGMGPPRHPDSPVETMGWHSRPRSSSMSPVGRNYLHSSTMPSSHSQYPS